MYAIQEEQMNEVIRSLLSRRSTKCYKPEMPAKELIDAVLEVGTHAATGMGRQSPIILAVTDPEVRNELSRINADIMGASADPFYGAPVVLTVLADKSIPTHVYDGSLVMGNMMQAATALGLGSCWIHRARETFERPEGKALLKKLGIEGEYEGIGNLVIGYAAAEPKPALPRKQDYIYYV